MIARLWRGWVATSDAEAYVGYVDSTGIRAYEATSGNLGAWILRRDQADGRTEIVTLSLWVSMDSVRGFAGPDPGRAVFYPEDDRYLVEREMTVSHFDVPVGPAAARAAISDESPVAHEEE